MIHLSKALLNRENPGFNDALKTEIEQLNASQLSLQAALSQSSYVSEESFRAMIIRTNTTEDKIQVRAGIFYTGIIAGCNCADDPTPVDTLPEYCEIDFEIDKKSGEASVELVSD